MTRRLSSKESSRSAAVKSRLDFPVIDTDVHVNDYTPALEDFPACAWHCSRAARTGARMSNTGPGLDRGIVFQDHRLFPWLTVEQNIGVGLRNSTFNAQQKRNPIAEHVALVGLEGFEKSFPHQISGGMAQRVAIARGLVNRPACRCSMNRLARLVRSRGRACRASCSASGSRSASPCCWSRTT